MDFKIITEAPSWYILLCVLLGLLFSFVAYFRNNKLSSLSKLSLFLLGLLRFTTVSFITFLLLNPLLKYVSIEYEKPIVIAAFDDSLSMQVGVSDSQSLNKKLNGFNQSIAESYELKAHRFGTEVSDFDSLSLKQKTTDFDNLFEEIENKYANKNIGALVVVSDGIYNTGINPIYQENIKNVPIYTVLSGDTNLYKDVAIKELYHNNLAYLGNDFPLEVVVKCEECENEKVKMTVLQSGVKVIEQQLDFTKKKVLTEMLTLEAKKVGLTRLDVKLESLADERVLQNNSRTVFIDVLDGRQKILMLYSGAHPDVGAIRSVLKKNENFSIDVAKFDKIKNPIKNYNLVICHGLPSNAIEANKLLKRIYDEQIGLLLFLNSRLDYSMLPSVDLGIGWRARSKVSFNDVYADLNPNFGLFKVSDKIQRSLLEFPPLHSPFINYKITVPSDALAFQRVGTVTTQSELMSFYDYKESKIGLISGEGLWRWNLFNKKVSGDNELFSELINKMVQYLSVKSDKSNFRLKYAKRYTENEDINFEAELYNESYELDNQSTISIELFDEQGKNYQFTFDQVDDKYRLNIGGLPTGKYNFRANTSLNGLFMEKSGVFIIDEVKVENINTRADMLLMKELAEKSGGKLFYINELDKLTTELKSREDIKPIGRSTSSLKELIHHKWLFYVLIGLISIEWLSRKLLGEY